MRRLVLVLGLASGCAKRGPSPESVDAVVVAPVDVAWGARSVGGLDAVSEALQEVPGSLKRRPEVVWRAVRLEVARGEVVDDPLAARRAYAEARALGMRCLRDERAVEGLLLAGRTVEAIRAVPQGRTGCAGWTGYAWARWIATMPGPGAATDREAVDALLSVVAVDPTPERLASIAWARVIVDLALGLEVTDPRAALRPELEGAWVRYEDLTRLAPERAGAPPTLEAVTPEDVAARRRVLASATP